ncbi:MAG: hypothetical protein JWO06_1407 [Bacteroidota bacterium]|nr:hypothetical protein [Bacteroidota bacterium]
MISSKIWNSEGGVTFKAIQKGVFRSKLRPRYPLQVLARKASEFIPIFHREAFHSYR